MKLDSRVPQGPIETAWDNARFSMKLVNPANKRRFNVIVVGSGLAGASAAASLGELGYNVKCFCFQDSPRRAHSIAAQGGINAAKNYQNDGDSIYRLFYDTVKGGDFRAREYNVYRLAQNSVKIIDQCVAQGVPFAREYGGLLANRSFGGAQVSRTFYARGQTGQQLLIGAYQALEAQVATGRVTMVPRTEMLDVVVVDGKARGIITRNLVTGQIESHVADAVVLATGGYGNVFYLSTNAKGSNCTAIWRAHKKGAAFGNPSFGNLVPRDVASRAAKAVCDEGRGAGSGETALGVYLDFAESINRLGRSTIEERYGNLFEMYERIAGEDPYKVPMRIYPAIHYTMGGLWVDYELMSSIPGMFVLGEANFSDHGANRLGASALMQGLSDGYFIIPYTLGNYLAANKPDGLKTNAPEFTAAMAGVQDRTKQLLSIKGKRTVSSFHRELGKIIWDHCGMARNAEGLRGAISEVRALRQEFWRDVNVPGSEGEINQQLENAGRVADFFELGELMCMDALERNESCGGHFREEYQTPDGEAMRDDENYQYVSAWEYKGEGVAPELNKEPLDFAYVHPAQRSYK